MSWFGSYVASDRDDGTEMVPETSQTFNELTWLMAIDFMKIKINYEWASYA
jgi:hypothetical protein